MKSKIDEVIYWVKENEGYSHEFDCIVVESEMLQELLEQLRPYVELGELVSRYEDIFEVVECNSFTSSVQSKTSELINQIKEQSNV